MRFFIVVLLACWLGPAVASAAQAQSATPAPASSTPVPDTQAAAPATQPASAPAGLDATRSLFDQTWRQFQFGGRFNSVSGDPARFQRYQDLRDGVQFTDVRYANEGGGGDWRYRLTAANVRYRRHALSAHHQPHRPVRGPRPLG